MKNLIIILSFCAASLIARAEVVLKSVEYKQGDTTLEGYVAYDNAIQGKRPGVLIVHQWKGAGDYEKKRAEMLAKLGYTAFALDIYGKGVRPSTPKDAGAMAGKFKSDRALLRARAQAGLDVLKAQPTTDPQHVAAIGYCFGGTTVLELARAGADVAGVVSFHGGLNSAPNMEATKVSTRVLACHGADDPFVPPAEVAAFKDEMKKAGAKLEFIAYPGAVHSFTDWNADGSMKGAQYNKSADEKSWAAMQKFLKDVLK